MRATVTRGGRAVLRRSARGAAAAAEPATGAPARLPILERLRLREERLRNRRGDALTGAMDGLTSFGESLQQCGNLPLRRRQTGVLQVNIGLLCNQTCRHCHVESGPARVTENMDRRTVERLLELIDASGGTVHTVDITGGAPELNPNFRYLVTEARGRGLKVIDRCNLTVLHEKGQEGLAEFLAEQGCEVVASLPCYSVDNVDAQRGDGVFDKSISSLQRLNTLGYGSGGALPLNLVYNPLGPSLPPAQPALEEAYKAALMEKFGIRFDTLFCITNLPVKRFADDLAKAGKLADYMKLLVGSFNPSTVESLMCLDHVSVRWDGAIFDCDFNQQQGLRMGIEGAEQPPPAEAGAQVTVWDVATLNDVAGAHIALGAHCYGCTAGSGSSCGGALQ